MWRTIRWAAGVVALQSVLFFLLEAVLPGLEARGIVSIVVGAAVISAVSGLAWPFTYSAAARLHPLLFPVLSFGLIGLVILLAVRVVDLFQPVGLEVRDVQTAILVWVLLTFGSTLLGAFFSLNDDAAYDRFVTGPLRRRYLAEQKTDVPGFLFLEIDGLSEPILQDAMTRGYMPTLKRWIASGSHRVVSWEPDLSSQTSASQAGILLGSNRDIPAFRWWDKPRGKLMQSSSMSNATELEEALSTGHGLLAGGGASRWNVFSGDAVDCLGTYSKIGDPTAGGRTSYYAYFSNPYSISRTAGLFVAEVVREWYQSIRQRMLDVRPRVKRGFIYAFIRAGTTVLLTEASRFMLTADMFRGLPAIYCTFFAYDEVAHHSGIDRSDSFKVLRMLDRMIAHTERVARRAPRPYHIVILSDHGQSQGATFRQRYGQTLSELVHALLTDRYQISSPATVDEGLTGLRSALTEAAQEGGPSARLAQRATQQLERQEVRLRTTTEDAAETFDTDVDVADVVVLASGNVGLISFPRHPERLTLEQMNELFPALVQGLAESEGISFVMAQSEADGGVVIGAEGLYFMDSEITVGRNPLSRFGPNAARHLRRTNSFSNAPDILVMSMFDERTQEVAAFEELVGSHGGLGGPQTQPFVMYPVTLPSDGDEPIVGAEHLHRVLRNWIAQAGPRGGRNQQHRHPAGSRDATRVKCGDDDQRHHL